MKGHLRTKFDDRSLQRLGTSGSGMESKRQFLHRETSTTRTKKDGEVPPQNKFQLSALALEYVFSGRNPY